MPLTDKLVKATQQFEGLGVESKGPLTSANHKIYLTIINAFSSLLFALFS